MTHRSNSLTARGTSGYKKSSKNSPNSLILADEFVPWNSTAPVRILSTRRRSSFATTSMDTPLTSKRDDKYIANSVPLPM